MSDLFYYPDVETHFIASKHVAQTFKIEVMQPARGRDETLRFPVVYATDGNWCFDMLKGISRIIQTTARDAPRFILVAIGYPGDSPRAGGALRARDLTFPGFPQFRPAPPPFEGVLPAAPGTQDTHGGEEFRQFIEHELIPFIDKAYGPIPGERTYFGHSGGGGFGLFTLFSRPALFNRYVISSAGVHYENDDFMIRHALAFAASAPKLEPTKLYLSVGTEEEFSPGNEKYRLTSSFYRLVALLRSATISNLELTAEAHPGETHMTAWPIAFMHGVQTVFGTRVK